MAGNLMEGVLSRLKTSLEKGDILPTVRVLFNEISSRSQQLNQPDSLESDGKDVFEFVLEHLESDTLGKDTCMQLVSILLLEIDSLSQSTSSNLAYKIIEDVKKGAVRKGRCLELFPKLVASLTETSGEKNGHKCDVNGEEERDSLLDTLCTIRWPTANVCALVTMCRDVKVTSKELKSLLVKAFDTIKTIQPPELPPIIYQLIALSAKGHRSFVLTGIVKLFNSLDQEVAQQADSSDNEITVAIPRTELLQTEGTVMVHIAFAIRQQQELGRELVDSVKSSLSSSFDSLMSPFCAAVLLSVSRIHGLQDQVFALLKSAVSKSIKDNERVQGSRWIRDQSKPVLNMGDVLQESVKNSLEGWDSVVEGLVAFSFYLMEGFSPKFPCTLFGDPSSAHQQQVCNIGSTVLIHVYEVHSIARAEIVKQVLKNIVTSSSIYSKHYIGALSGLVRNAECREAVLDPSCIRTMEEVLHYLPLLPLHPAEDFMEAVQPLLKYSVALKECLLVVLRNALLSRRVDGRCIAVKGYLLLLRHAEILDDAALSSQSSQPVSGSQVFVELHGTNVAASNEALCLEILGHMRRCLTQQAEVRRTFYEGVYAVFCANGKLQLSILEFLMDHLSCLVVSDPDAVVPLNLDRCLTQLPSGLTAVKEPVDALLGAIVLCYRKYRSSNNQDSAAPAVLKMIDCLRSLTLKLAKIELGDVGIDKDSDVSSTSNAGSKNLCTLSLLSKSCEVLIEFVYTAGECSEQSCDQVVQLNSSCLALRKPGTEKTAAKRGHGKGAGTSSVAQGYFNSCFSLPSLLDMLAGLHSDSSPAHQPGLAVLRDSSSFCRHALLSSVHLLTSLLDSSHCAGLSSAGLLDEAAAAMKGFGRAFLKQLHLTYLPPQGREDGKGKSVASLSIEGLSIIVTHCSRLSSSACLGILSGMVSADNQSAALSSTALLMVRQFQRLVNGALSDPPEVEGLVARDVVALAGIIQHLSTLLDQEGMGDVLKWVFDICKDRRKEDVLFCKGFLTLLFSLYQRCDIGLKLVKKVCVDVHISVGDIDEEVNVDGRKTLELVTPFTAAHCLNVVLAHIDTVIGHVEWFVEGIRTEVSHASSLECVEAVCKEQLVVLIHSFHELTQTSLTPGPSVDAIVKLITRLYNTLKDVTKYLISIYSPSDPIDLPLSFTRVVDLTGTQLNPNVYSYIHYIQSVQVLMASGESGQAGKKGKSKTSTSTTVGARKVLKELKSVPPMIFSVEEYEKFLIKLGKKAKVDLMKSFKRSTARDFRINSAAVTAILAEDMEDEPSPLLKDGNNDENMCP